MKIISLLLLSALFATANIESTPPAAAPSFAIGQKVIIPQLGLLWMRLDEQAGQGAFAVALGFGPLPKTRLYPGELISIKTSDATGDEIATSAYYEFNKGRSTVFFEFSRMPQGGWVLMEGSVAMSPDYSEEKYTVKLGGDAQKIQGDGFSYACSVDAERPHEFIFHQRGFGHLTQMGFYDEQGKYIDPLANRVIKSQGGDLDMAFIFDKGVDLSKLSFRLERRVAKSPQIVPVKLRFNIAGAETAGESVPHQGRPPIALSSPPAELGSMRVTSYSLAQRAGVAGGRFHGVNLGILLTPPTGKKVVIKPKQRIKFDDGGGFNHPANLSFVTPKEGGTILLSFSIDTVPRALPFAMKGDIETEVDGQPMTLPIELTFNSFPGK